MSDVDLFILLDALRMGFHADDRTTIDEWADGNRILTTETSAEPGPWRTSRVPYMREVMRCLSNGSPWERVVLMFGSQLGKTEVGLNWLGYIIDRAPGPIISVSPTVDMAKDSSKTRIDKMIETTPTLAAKVKDAKSRDGGNTMLMKEFPGGYLYMTGANSPSTLSAKPIRYAFMDEVDRFPGDVGGEGDPLELVVTRTRTFPRRKILATSTPTLAGISRIETMFMESDRRRYYVPCPECGHMQTFEFSRLKWPDGQPDLARYECASCGRMIGNHEKTAMLDRGEWRADVKTYRGNTVGFHVSSLYSPVGWYTWGEIATQFIKAKKNPSLLKVFVNTVLGETWKDAGEAPEWERLYMRREDYQIGTIPMGGLLLTAGVDVQKDRIEAQVIAWGRERRSWVIDYQAFPGDPSDTSSACWSMLDTLLTRRFPHVSGADLTIRAMCVDTGYATQEVYLWCRRHKDECAYAIKGSDAISMPVSYPPKAVDVVENNKRRSKALKLWSVGVSLLKSELYGLLRLPMPDGEDVPPGWIHFPDLNEEYFRQLCAETLIIKELKGRRHYEWTKIRDRNEALDTFIYARAGASILKIEQYRDAEWKRLEDSIGTTKAPVIPRSLPTEEPAQPAQAGPAVRQSWLAKKKRGMLSRGLSL